MSNNFAATGTALVTGASSGIGAIYADRLARRGYDLILVARSRDRLDELANRLANESGRRIKVVAADLNTRVELALIEDILRSDSSVTMLVNNASVGATAPLLASDIEKMDHMIALNISALTRLTYAAVPGFVKRANGSIINIASIVGVAPELLNGVYGGTKAFVLAFTRSLSHELSNKNIRIQAVLPGATDTDFWQLAGTPKTHLPEQIIMDAADMVDAALAGYDQGELFTVPSLSDVADWQAYEAARQKLLPNLSHRAPAARYRQASAA
ncbi:SDR family NAD(P)-dependent oxidoreductase [Bradyrhizobium sp. USDA 4486]